MKKLPFFPLSLLLPAVAAWSLLDKVLFVFQVNGSDYTAGYATFFDKLQAAEGVIDKIEMGVEQDEFTAENRKGVMNRSSPEEHRSASSISMQNLEREKNED